MGTPPPPGAVPAPPPGDGTETVEEADEETAASASSAASAPQEAATAPAGGGVTVLSLRSTDRFSLSTSREWNLLSELCDADAEAAGADAWPAWQPPPPWPPPPACRLAALGGEHDADLHGDCSEARDDARLENCRLIEDMATGTDDRWWPGDATPPTTKSLPGDVDRLGPSDLLHSLTLRERGHDCGFEHSELRRDLPVL